MTESLESRALRAADLVSGQSVSATLSAVDQIDTYTIAVDAGAPLLITLRESSVGGDLSPHLEVLGPGGQSLIDDVDSNGLTSVVTTPATGTYQVRVSDATGDATGSYTLTAFRPTTDVSEDDLIRADSGRRFATTVDPGDVDFWSIDASVGQQVGVIVTENNAGSAMSPDVTLVGPGGQILAHSSDAAGVGLGTRATGAGTFYAIVTEGGDDDSGIYGLTMTRVPGTQYSGDPDTAALASGVTRNGDLPGGDADVFSISGTAGDTIAATLNRSTGSLDPDMVIYGPDGAQLAQGTRTNAGATSSVSVTAATTGTYWIIARDFESDDGGRYDFRYDLTAATPPPANDGEIVNGTLTVNGTAGADRIAIATSGSNLVVVRNGVTKSYSLSAIQTLRVVAGGDNDSVDLRGTTIAAYVAADSGDDTVYGGAGADTILGGGGRNRLYGGDGNDRLSGAAGRDFLNGEGGDDRLYGQAGNDVIDGGGGRDRLYGADGDDLLLGGSSNDRLYADTGNDTLIGGKGNDQLDGGAGNDLVQSKEPGDTLISIESP